MNPLMIFTIFIAVILGGVFTFYINHTLKKGPVFASSIVALLSGIVFPLLFGDSGLILAAAVTAGSYAGMSGKKYIENYIEMIIVSIFLAILFIISNDVFVGVGGKLGTIACISVISLYGIKTFFEKISLKKNTSKSCGTDAETN